MQKRVLNFRKGFDIKKGFDLRVRRAFADLLLHITAVDGGCCGFITATRRAPAAGCLQHMPSVGLLLY
jgi:hypothetical protein